MTAKAAGPGWAGYLLGFSLGGFFDGILLHQILQWHHLLSAFDPDNARFQIAADGYFHALMYLIAAAGIWLLWGRPRSQEPQGVAGLVSDLLIGFGAWHVLDGIAFHWLLGIHRIRMDSDNRLVWDVLWFTVFGVVPLIAGFLIGRQGGGTGRPRAAAVLLAALVVGAGAQALRPPTDNPFTTVLFAPGATSVQVFAAIDAVGGRLVWSDTAGELVVIVKDPDQSALKLFARGAILVSGTGLPPGCLAYLRKS